MKILVVGGAGYIGSVCSELLLDEGHEVSIFDNLGEGHRRAIDPRAHFTEGDLADRSAIETALSRFHPERGHAFCGQRPGGRIDDQPVEVFPQ